MTTQVPSHSQSEAVDRMQALVEQLCSPVCLPRNPGTEGGAAARDLLRAELEALGLEPAGEKSYDQIIPGNGGTNLLGLVRGTGDRYVVLGAHYDACGPDNPGADDNASAVAVTLEMARALQEMELDRSVLIALFDAEEPPYFLSPNMGSQWFVDHPTVPLDSIDMMVCVDLVGHALGPDELPASVRDSIFVLGAEKSTGTGELVDRLPTRKGIVPRRIDNYIIASMSDYDAFMNAGIPFLFYSCGRWEHYHQATDTPDRLDYAKMSGLVEHLTDLIAASANRSKAADFTAGGFDDAATLDTISDLIGHLEPFSPEAATAGAMVGAIRERFTVDGALEESDRMAIQMLVQRIEGGLA